MSVVPFLLPRPSYTLTNIFSVPVNSPGAQGQDDTLWGFVNFLFPITILIDNFLDDLAEGRSFGEEQARVYSTVAARLRGQFGVDGDACILRFIFELQQRPISHWTLLGDVLTLLFTPRSGNKDADRELLKEYLAAEILGLKEDVDCSSLYSSCPFSVFHYFDTFRNMTESTVPSHDSPHQHTPDQLQAL